jgi:uncharacterized repeat protein (TIGR03803 family)
MNLSKTALSHFFMLATILFVETLAPAAWAVIPEKLLHSFNGTSGIQPMGLSMDAAGNLWGVTAEGGVGCPSTQPGCGTVFELTPISGGWKPKAIYAFKGGTDGALPWGNLAFDGQGNVYGTTIIGGSTACGCGVVYELTPQSGSYKETVLYRFTGYGDGNGPVGGPVLDAAGNLYGTTSGGGTSGWGTVFELSLNGGTWTQSILHNFTPDPDGAEPSGSLVFDAQGNLYGTTTEGGTGRCSGTPGGCGTVFEVSPGAGSGWTESVLYNFKAGDDGYDPISAVVVGASGSLYGATYLGGGTGCSELGCGTVFELTSDGAGAWTETVIRRFSTPAEGSNPSAGLVFGSNGSLYGVTLAGGLFGLGTAFELTPGSAGWTESILHNFGNGNDGQLPDSTLVFDSAGNLYGTTYYGGADESGVCDGSPIGCGTVFQLTP